MDVRDIIAIVLCNYKLIILIVLSNKASDSFYFA